MEIKYYMAYNGSNERIPIYKALRGVQYKCLDCHGILIPKMGNIKIHHYAHKSLHDCKGEGQKHKLVKHMIYDILNMNGDLFPEGELKMEKYHLGLQPDVSIIWSKDNYLAIEVCDTNESSDIKKQIYGDNMIEFKISDWGEEEISNPLFVINQIYPSLYKKIVFNEEDIEYKNRIDKLKYEIQKLDSKKYYIEEDITELYNDIREINKDIDKLKNKKENIIKIFKGYYYKDSEDKWWVSIRKKDNNIPKIGNIVSIYVKSKDITITKKISYIKQDSDNKYYYVKGDDVIMGEEDDNRPCGE